jgi:hypothetical protein
VTASERGADPLGRVRRVVLAALFVGVLGLGGRSGREPAWLAVDVVPPTENALFWIGVLCVVAGVRRRWGHLCLNAC